MRRTWVFTVAILIATNADAACQCLCVGGEVKAVCQSSIDLEPICSPRVCPITPPSVKPITPSRVPPVGTSKCVPKQVWDEDEGRYVWRELCY